MKVKASEFVSKGMKLYTYATIEDRAIPSLEDGLKPVQRYIIYAMYLNNIRKFTKTSNVEGEVFKYSPHGSSFPAIVNLTTKNKQHIQYITGEGSFGDATSKNINAADGRYTSCKLNKNSDIVLKELKNNGIEMTKSYDGEKDVPVLLPATAPMVLLNYIEGIAVAYATKILPMNSVELYNLLKEKLYNKPLTLCYPDFPNGCLIEKNEQELKRLYKTGKAKFMLSSVYEIKDKSIIFKNIPENVMREVIIEEINNLKDNKIVPEIKKVADNSGLNGFEIEVITKKDPEKVANTLLQKTSLHKSINANTNVLCGGKLKELGIEDILDKWINWRKSVLQKEIDNYIQQQTVEKKKAQTLIYFKENKDKFLPLITESDNPKEELMNYFSEKQADLILSMRIQQLSKSDEKKLKEKVDKIKTTIEKANNVDINELILKTYKETVPMLDRKSQVIEPIKFKKVETMSQKSSFKFNIEGGFFVKGNNIINSDERLIVITEDNIGYTYAQKDIKDGLFITDKKIVWWGIIKKDNINPIYIEFENYHLLLEKGKLFTSRKKTKNFLFDNPLKIQDPNKKQIKEMIVKKTRKSRGVKK